MHTRPIRAYELDLFVEAGGTGHYKEVKQYLENMFTAGAMRPEWCFVVQEEERVFGRVALGALPGADRPLAMVLLDVYWEGEHLVPGTLLLRDVLDRTRAMGTEKIEQMLDDPPMYPQFQHYPEKESNC